VVIDMSAPADSTDDAPRSFDDVYRAELRSVVAMAYGLSGSRTAAEELAQDAFLAAHRRWDEIGAYADPGAWVRRVVVNRSVSLFRRRAAEARALVRLASRPTPPAALPPDDAEFWRAVRRLPARQAQSIALHYLEDRSVDDIAGILGCAPATVRVHLHRGRQALAAALGCSTDEEDT
jgi:RNA polymerase sigma-70 factor (ECF subfamily)